MLLCAEYILPITSAPIEKGAVLIRGDKIADIGKADTLRARYPEEEARDFGQSVVLPGFVDVHSHLEYSALRGIVHDKPYAEWLPVVTEISSRMSHSDLYSSAVVGSLEALSLGITCVGDITTTSASVEAMDEVGLRAVVYREVSTMDKRRVDYAMRQALADIEKWSVTFDSSRISIGIAPGALYICNPLVFKRISECAGNKLPVAMHIAGSREEYNFIKYGSSSFSVDSMSGRRGYVEVPPWLPTGVTPVNYALNWGAFEPENVMAVHCVHVDENDIEKLRDNDVSIAYCPRCNAQLGMGTAPVGQYLRAGLRVGLGSDSPAATNSSDMLVEMRIGMLVQRAASPEFLPAHSMLEMATIGGARALHMDDAIGSLEIGKQADVIAIDVSGSHQMPTDDPMGAVVNTASGLDVTMTMVAGKVLYEQNQWHVNVEAAKNIARTIEVRGRLRNRE